MSSPELAQIQRLIETEARILSSQITIQRCPDDYPAPYVGIHPDFPYLVFHGATPHKIQSSFRSYLLEEPTLL